MFRSLAILFDKRFSVAALLLAGPLAAFASEPFPIPAELQRDVDFWVRVYTEIDTTQGFVHDDRNLAVVYDTLNFRVNQSARSRQKKIDSAKKRYRRMLEKLASGQRSRLSREEERILALWPENVSNQTLRAAATDIRFQLGQADRFRHGLIRSGEWQPYIREIFASYGLPEDLAVLPHVESSYNPRAYSRAHAAGLWQFVRSTGRLYMRVDHVVDGRLDPLISTDAAARLLRDNYARSGSWPIALTAYNHGPAGMSRAVARMGTKDIAVIVRQYDGRRFGFASRNFYVSFLAAREVSNNYEKYLGPIKSRPLAQIETIRLDEYVPAKTVAVALDVDVATMKILNPALRSPVWSGDKHIPAGYPLRIPNLVEMDTLMASIPANQRFTQQRPDLTYKIQRGDTLSHIATRFGHSVRDIQELNGLRSRHRIRAGQVIKLPNPASAATVPTVATRQPVVEAVPTEGIYLVRKGDTLSEIATRYGFRVSEIVAVNELRSRHRLKVGQGITLPGVETTDPQPEAAESKTVAVDRADKEAAAPTGLVDDQMYVVKRGDTVDRIARRIGVPADTLVVANGLLNRHRIYAGQKLIVPDSLDSPVRTPVLDSGRPHLRGVSPDWPSTPLE